MFFVDVFDCIFINGLSSVPSFVSFTYFMAVGRSQNRKPFRYLHKNSQAETTLVTMEARETGLLFSSSNLQSFGLSIAVRQRSNKEEHHPVDISCLPDFFKVVKAHSIEASFCSTVR